MDKNNLQHDTIDGNAYRNLIINAAQCLEDNKEEINELNVFPVPDGDTGSNMSMTVANAAKELEKGADMPLDQTAEKTAKAMLHGARGNSGVIISLLFRGIAKGLKNSFECDGIVWAEALEKGVEAAYGAVDHPAEGTILTVARKCAEAAKNAAIEYNSFEYVLGVAIEAAEVALDETIKQNPTLEKSGVVDAGGMGWLLVMKAMFQALSHKGELKFSPKSELEKKPKADFSSFETEDITFSFCTEFIITKNEPDCDSSPLKSYLSTMGDSLVFLDDGEIIKVHVHTNEPHTVLGEALKWGIYETVKVENMRTQHTNKIVDTKDKQVPTADYGIISVCSGDGIGSMFKELGVDVIVSGGQTMNPSTEDLYNAVCQINAKNIIILPNNKNIIMTASQVNELTDKNIIVIPTRSIPQGISACLAFNQDASADENKEAMTEVISETDTMQITYAARNSNFDGMDISEGDYLGICNDKLVTNDNALEKILDAFSDKIKESEKSVVTIFYGEDVSEQEAEKTLSYLTSKLSNEGIEISLYQGGQPVYYYIISAE